MTVFQSLILSLLQGVTEFLPISSSGHLLVLPQFFSWPDQGLAFDAALHLGTALAVLIYFRSQIIPLIQSLWTKSFHKERQLVWLILVSMIPAMIIGILFKDFFANGARSITLVSVNLILWGGVLFMAEYWASKQLEGKQMNQLSKWQAFLIGGAQSLALLPGTSRSGITISAGLFLGLTRKEAVTFSFLMGIPVIIGAGTFSLLDVLQQPSGINQIGPLFIGLLGAFVSGLVAIHWLLKFVEKRGLYFFAAYRFLLALFLLFAF